MEALLPHRKLISLQKSEIYRIFCNLIVKFKIVGNIIYQKYNVTYASLYNLTV